MAGRVQDLGHGGVAGAGGVGCLEGFAGAGELIVTGEGLPGGTFCLGWGERGWGGARGGLGHGLRLSEMGEGGGFVQSVTAFEGVGSPDEPGHDG